MDSGRSPAPAPQCADCGAAVERAPGRRPPARCPDCTRARKRERQAQRHRERWATDPEYRARYAQRQRERHADPEYRARENQRLREKRATDHEFRARENQRQRERYASDPEYRSYKQEFNRRRQQRSGTRLRDLVPLIVRQGALCPLCGERLPASATDIEIDHIVPVARGGSEEEQNLQAVCKPCNRRKGANNGARC